MTAGIEKLVPSTAHAFAMLRLLVRSATGGDITQYTTFHCGPKRPGDPDGPEEFHVVLLDNGRSRMLGTGFKDMLRCIRCGACMNHCPVYRAVGGHAYGWVYPGPMGAVLTPSLIGARQGARPAQRLHPAAAARRSAPSTSRCPRCCAAGATVPGARVWSRSPCGPASASGPSSPVTRASTGSRARSRPCDAPV